MERAPPRRSVWKGRRAGDSAALYARTGESSLGGTACAQISRPRGVGGSRTAHLHRSSEQLPQGARSLPITRLLVAGLEGLRRRCSPPSENPKPNHLCFANLKLRESFLQCFLYRSSNPPHLLVMMARLFFMS